MDCVDLHRGWISIRSTVARPYGQPERPAGRTQPSIDCAHAVYRYPLQMDQPGDREKTNLIGVCRYSGYESRWLDQGPGPRQAHRLYPPAWPGNTRLKTGRQKGSYLRTLIHVFYCVSVYLVL